MWTDRATGYRVSGSKENAWTLEVLVSLEASTEAPDKGQGPAKNAPRPAVFRAY